MCGSKNKLGSISRRGAVVTIRCTALMSTCSSSSEESSGCSRPEEDDDTNNRRLFQTVLHPRLINEVESSFRVTVCLGLCSSAVLQLDMGVFCWCQRRR